MIWKILVLVFVIGAFLYFDEMQKTKLSKKVNDRRRKLGEELERQRRSR